MTIKIIKVQPQHSLLQLSHLIRNQKIIKMIILLPVNQLFHHWNHLLLPLVNKWSIFQQKIKVKLYQNQTFPLELLHHIRARIAAAATYNKDDKDVQTKYAQLTYIWKWYFVIHLFFFLKKKKKMNEKV